MKASSFWSGVLAAALVQGAALTTPATTSGQGTTPPSAAPDFTEYQRLLDDYLSVVSEPGKPIETRIDYMRLSATPDVKQRFAQIRGQLFGVTPSTLASRERLAWAINAYNYLAIETVTNNLFESRGKRARGDKIMNYGMRIAHVMTISLRGGGFFTAPLIDIEGVPYSLNDFERRFVFDGYDHKSGAAAPAKLDPRPHFAVVCASNGCPPLMQRAYKADSLDRQLDFATRNALASPRHLLLFERTGQFLASSIFDWYQADFGGPEGAVVFAKKYAPAAVRKQMEARNVQKFGVFIKWDWSLNDLETRQTEGSG